MYVFVTAVTQDLNVMLNVTVMVFVKLGCVLVTKVGEV